MASQQFVDGWNTCRDTLYAQVPKRDSETHFALREAHLARDSIAYFNARPALDNGQHKSIFEAGFVRGFDAGEKVYALPIISEEKTQQSAKKTEMWVFNFNNKVSGITFDSKEAKEIIVRLEENETYEYYKCTEGDKHD